MGKRKLLAIGISYKNAADGISPLTGPGEDAWKVIKAFNDNGRYNDLKLITDDWETIKERDDWMDLVSDEEKPYKEKIIEGIEWLVKDAEAGDELFFFYSGHGAQDDDKDENEEEDGQDECLIAIDDDIEEAIILDDDLYDKMVKDLCEGVRLVAVIDACNSGTMLDLPYVEKEGVLEEVANTKTDSEADVVLISGSKDDQKSWEVKGVGLLTKAFLKICREEWDLDINYLKLLKDLRFDVNVGSGYLQTVQLSSNKYFDLEETKFKLAEEPLLDED